MKSLAHHIAGMGVQDQSQSRPQAMRTHGGRMW